MSAWSRVVHDLDEARAALADPGDVLDLRAAAALSRPWAELGFVPVAPGELTCPLAIELPSVAATEALGSRLAGGVWPGDLLVLSGPLGAGKTALVRGLGAGLGVRGAVTSPTFVLARRHPGPVPLVHVDAYRLRAAGSGDPGAVDLDDLDVDAEEAVVAVEWGEDLAGLPSEKLHITLERGSGTTVWADASRVARVVAQGQRWRTVQLPRTQSGHTASGGYPTGRG